MTDTERDDVLRAAGGDLQAFERIVKAWADRIQAVGVRILGNREDARDAAQEVFVKLYRRGKRLLRLREKETASKS
jgi:RNA polymerase sigma-70 factor (ECF subfamily)